MPKNPPESMQHHLRQRLNGHARQNWPQLTGVAVRERGLALAGRIATATGARIIAQGSNARIQRGAGRVPIERLPYPVDQALAVLKDVRHLILVGAKAPVAFFARTS